MIRNRSPRWFLLFWAVLTAGACAADASGVSQIQAGREPAAGTVSVQALDERPEDFLQREVEVAGRLTNAGTGYFSDLRLVLTDAEGHAIEVIPWVPLAYPPLPPDASRQRPPMLSDFLDRRVRLVGTLERMPDDLDREVYALRVRLAEIVP